MGNYHNVMMIARIIKYNQVEEIILIQILMNNKIFNKINPRKIKVVKNLILKERKSSR